jgi:signal transduction histidine kinase
MRRLLDVLREDEAEWSPQPTLARLAELITEARAGGLDVSLSVEGEQSGLAPGVELAAYRIVQEALTNARKHAPGADVTLTLRGRPGDGLTVDVRNPAPAGPVPRVPGSGQGLIGLTERAALAGGRMEHGPTPDGGFALRAWLPWPA